jgi:hypothetical protein
MPAADTELPEVRVRGTDPAGNARRKYRRTRTAAEPSMSDHEIPVEPRPSWYRKVAMVIGWFLLWPTVPFALVFLLVLGLYAFIHIVVSELLFCARMRQCGRFLRWRRLGARIAEEGTGTFIIESPSLGCGFTHAWWTPEKVLTVSPYAVPTDDDYRNSAEKMQCLYWDRWHWENYTDPDKGRGFLLRVWNGRSLAKWVRRTFPSIDVVHTWTALVHAPKPPAERGGA